MAEATYLMCGLTSLFCAVLLVRSFLRTRSRLLLASSLCFVGLAANNALLVVDFMIFPDVDLLGPRTGVAAVAMLMLLIGLIWESR